MTENQNVETTNDILSSSRISENTSYFIGQEFHSDGEISTIIEWPKGPEEDECAKTAAELIVRINQGELYDYTIKCLERHVKNLKEQENSTEYELHIARVLEKIYNILISKSTDVDYVDPRNVLKVKL